MKFKKNILIIIGAVLLIAQILSFVGVTKSSHGLYPDRTVFLYPYRYSSAEPGLSLGKVIVAVLAGNDRFHGGFEDLLSSNEYRASSSTQMSSAVIRESLGCSDEGSFGLVVYDTVVTVAYFFYGISGIVLLIIGTKVKRKIENRDYNNYPEDTGNDSGTNDPSAPSWERFLK